MIRVCQSWVIFSYFMYVGINLWNLSWSTIDTTPDRFGVARAMACRFWTCRSKHGPKTDSWKRKMNTFIKFRPENVGISPMNQTNSGEFHASMVWNLEPFVPAHQDNAICDAGAQALYDICSRRQWVWRPRQHPMVRGPGENWEYGGCVPTFVGPENWTICIFWIAQPK